MTMTNKTRQIIVVVAVFVIALASLGTIIGLLVNTGQMSEYSDGFRFELSGSRATITGYEGSDTDVVIPDKLKGHRVASIAKDAFKDTSVKSIKFNCTYSSFKIESDAFAKLTSLEKVVLPKNLKEIPSGAFEGCTALKTAIVPNSVTSIGSGAFKDCNVLSVVYNSERYSTDGDNAIKNTIYLPTSLLEIGASAFENCGAVTTVYIYKNLEKIGDKAFKECDDLIRLQIESNSEITSIGAEAFYNTNVHSTTSMPLTFPNLVSIGARAFSGNSSVDFTYMKLPTSVTSIGAYAFAESTYLNKVEMDKDMKIETMGQGVFKGCRSLINVTLPTEIKEIPAYTFMGCYQLLNGDDDFVIGKNVESIGDGAFALYAGAASDTKFENYIKRILLVDEENEHFTTIRLADNYRDDDANSTFRQGLLTDAAGETVYAYYGSYDTKSYIKDNGRTFRLLNVSGMTLSSLKTIKPYAFAGVKFEYIEIPVTIKAIDEYAFYKSSVTTCYSYAIDWEFTQNTFLKVNLDLFKDEYGEDANNSEEDVNNYAEIEVLLPSDKDGIEDFLRKLGEVDIKAGTFTNIAE